MSIILAIDDDANTLKLMQIQLKSVGHELYTVNNPAKGLDFVKTMLPDLILLDYNMPEMTGFDLIRNLKKDSSTKNIPIIMISSFSDRNIVMDAMRYGIFDYIIKPWDKDRLFSRIMACLKYSDIKKKSKDSDSSLLEYYNDERAIVLTFKINPDRKEFLNEAKKIFTPFFFKNIKNRMCLIDVRSLEEIEENDIMAIEKISTLFKEEYLGIIAGRHFGKLLTEGHFEDRVQIFLSYGDWEISTENKDS